VPEELLTDATGSGAAPGADREQEPHGAPAPDAAGDDAPARDPGNPASPWTTAREYGWLTAAVAAVVAIMVRPWSGGWHVPITYGGDTLSVLAMVDGAGWTGTAVGPSSLGAPYGLSWTDFPLGPDRLHLVAFRLVRLFGVDGMTALNLTFLLGFFLVAWASYAVLRSQRISALVAGTVSVVFTIVPYHFARISDGHLFLAAYFAVPLGVLLALWASDGTLARPLGRGRAAVLVGCVLVVGSSSAYYAAFAVVLVLALGVATALRRGSWRALVAPGLVAVAVLGVVVANTAGTLLTARDAGVNLDAATRPASDSDAFGLRLAQLVLPTPDHRIEALGALGQRAAEVDRPGESGAQIGLLAVLGLVAIGATCARRLGRERAGDAGRQDALMARLGVLSLAAVLAATMGGAGLVVASLGVTQIRVWSRMSIVLAFLGLTGLAVVLDRVRDSALVRGRSLGPAILALVVVAVAIVDQTSPGSLAARDWNARLQQVDREVAEQLEAALPADADVFQLPYVGFPSGRPEGDLPLYGLLGPWTAGSGALSYSAAAMQGRGGDWQRSWTTRPPEVLVPGLAAAGFDALYLDRRGEPTATTAPVDGDLVGDTAQGTDTSAVASWLRRSLGAPAGVVRDGAHRREWFDLRPVRDRLVARHGADRVRQLGEAVRRPIGVVLDGAVDRFAVPGGTRLLLADSTITLRDEDAAERGAPRPVVVRFELRGEPGTTVRIEAGGRVRQEVLGAGPTTVELVLEAAARDEVITVHTDAGRLVDAAARLGDVRLQLSQVEVVDEELDRAVGRGELTLGP